MNLPDTVYHLADESNWPSIQEYGLLSASELMRASGIEPDSRIRLERTQRLSHTELPSGVHIRDQRPMPPSALEACLIGLSPADWYALVNARVFFWLDPDRLNRQRAACKSRTQVVLSVSTARLLDAHRDQMAVTPINTGNARRKPARRGVATFVPYAAWIQSGWESESAALDTPLRKRSHRPVEATVAGSVPHVMQFVINVSKLSINQAFDPHAASPH